MSKGLEQVLEAFNVEFPGWWWKVGECYVSCDATIAPDRYGPDDDLLRYRTFNNGFEVDLRQPSTVADALLTVMDMARQARREFREGTEASVAMELAAEAEQRRLVEIGLKAKK